jgi:hypothetical protein
MSAVWEHAPYDAGALLVLLALSDYANDEGQCWPNVSSIAGKTRLGVRQVHNILRQLKSDGAISIKPGGGRGVSNRYQIHTETLKSISVKSDSVKPISVKSATETVQSIAQNSAICDIAIRKNRQEPSIEPSAAQLAYVSVDQVQKLYDLYPRKREPIHARKAIRTAINVVMAGDPDHPAMSRNEALDYLAQRLTLYAKCVQGYEREFIPYPATWFNAGSFWDGDGEWSTRQSHPAVTGNVMDRFNSGA